MSPAGSRPRASGSAQAAGASEPAHRLATPRRARVAADSTDGRPLAVDGRAVDAIRESWLVEDRWWNGAPVRRRYWEVVTTCGRNLMVFHDLRGGAWFMQQ